jgi:N-acetyl-anhydromuramyl-L-alanine amidase AmpD
MQLEIFKKWETPRNLYTQKEYKKKQIVLHHTVSGEGYSGDIATMFKRGYVVAFMIERNGNIHQLFDEKYSGNHLGIPAETFSSRGIPYQKLDLGSIGIELDSWGQVLPVGDKFYPVKWENGKFVPRKDCAPLANYPESYCTKYRGFEYYERYTPQQLASLEKLLNFLMAKHEIHNTYLSDMWDVCNRALKGYEGVFSHTSYRKDKFDVHPQPELVNLLKSLR